MIQKYSYGSLQSVWKQFACDWSGGSDKVVSTAWRIKSIWPWDVVGEQNNCLDFSETKRSEAYCIKTIAQGQWLRQNCTWKGVNSLFLCFLSYAWISWTYFNDRDGFSWNPLLLSQVHSGTSWLPAKPLAPIFPSPRAGWGGTGRSLDGPWADPTHGGQRRLMLQEPLLDVELASHFLTHIYY